MVLTVVIGAVSSCVIRVHIVLEVLRYMRRGPPCY